MSLDESLALASDVKAAQDLSDSMMGYLGKGLNAVEFSADSERIRDLAIGLFQRKAQDAADHAHRLLADIDIAPSRVFLPPVPQQ